MVKNGGLCSIYSYISLRYNMNKPKQSLGLFMNTFYEEKCMSKNYAYDIII